MTRVIFICTGNTCRSPMAEGLFRARLREAGEGRLTADSAGMFAHPDDPVTAEAAAACREIGVDIADHTARQLEPDDWLDPAALLVPLTHVYADRLLAAGVPREKLYIPMQSVADPFGGDLAVYRSCRDQIDGVCRNLLDEWQKRHPRPAVRPVTPDDLPALAEIEAACFSHPWSEQALRDELARDDAVILCAVVDGRPVAYGSMRGVVDEGSIGNLACLPAYRQQGAGGAVLDGLIAAARRRGWHRLVLEVRPSNTAALCLYRSRGFREVGRRKNFYRDPVEDGLLLAVTLD